MDLIILDFLLNDTDDDEDDDDGHNFRVRRPRIFRRRVNWFLVYDETDFKARFRLSKKSVFELYKIVEPLLQYNTERNNAVSPMIQLLVGIRFLATGCFMITVGDFHGVSKVSAHTFIHRVSWAIAILRPHFIVFPSTPREIRQAQVENFQKAAFIRAVAAIDCFHARVRSYGGDDALLFRNRKGFFSINIQLMVNSRLQILDLVASWPGSIHDSTIFDFSEIKRRFLAGEFENALLVGDAGYSQEPYLMTPLHDPVSPAELLYNESQIRTRTMVERTIGIWGRMFAVLTIGSRCHRPVTTIPMIVASAVLYNICRINEPAPTVNYNVYDAIPLTQNNIPLHANERQYLIDNYFDRL